MMALLASLAGLSFGWHLLFLLLILSVCFFLFRRSFRLRPYCGQLLLLTFFFLVAILFYLLTFTFKRSPLASGVSARSMPQLWALLLLLSGGAVLVEVLRGGGTTDRPLGRWQLVMAFFLTTAVSICLLPLLGYYLSSALFLLTALSLLGERRPSLLIGVPAGWCLFTYAVFHRLLLIPLPTGSLFSSLF